MSRYLWVRLQNTGSACVKTGSVTKKVSPILTNIIEETVYLNINADPNSGTSSHDERRRGKCAAPVGP